MEGRTWIPWDNQHTTDKIFLKGKGPSKSLFDVKECFTTTETVFPPPRPLSSLSHSLTLSLLHSCLLRVRRCRRRSPSVKLVSVGSYLTQVTG